jgi:polar amino acid transport system ATP-binding protein
MPQAAPSGAKPMIRFKGICKAFGSLVVLDDLDLDIAPAEKVALIGPSGSGKSTLLRVLMTLERPDKGSIEIDGAPLWHMPKNGNLVPADARHLHEMRKNVGMVFQQFNLFPHMTVSASSIKAGFLNRGRRTACSIIRRMNGRRLS